MCGIGGIVTAWDRRLSIDRSVAERLRDRLAHRGPDDAGLYESPPTQPHAMLVHRRLAVVDPGPAGRQPMVSPAGSVLVYNGELYNDAELRDELAPWLADHGRRFQTTCDTETVLVALERWGPDGLDRLRGMYALAWYDPAARALLLARDPLGIKPLYTARVPVAGGVEFVFASEPAALFAHPHLSKQPDWSVVSGYLTSIRLTFGRRTLFEGVETLEPGERVAVDCSLGSLPERRWFAPSLSVPQVEANLEAWAELVRTTVRDSVRRHTRADRPVCSLLSGGLDSTVVANEAIAHANIVHTYCAGHPDGDDNADLAVARRIAAALGTDHAEAPIDELLFRERWGWMIDTLGVPIGTPNEIAIFEVARLLRSRGEVVALSGEGADELFGGYELPLRRALDHVLAAGEDADDGGLFQLDSAAWVARDAKAAVLNEPVLAAIDNDTVAIDAYRTAFDRAGSEPAADEPFLESRLHRHLRTQRRLNLTGLLGRLDTSTMLAGVEGRTPLADVGVAGAAAAVPMAGKFTLDDNGASTKIALREAFAGFIPDEAARRPKASFPLPVAAWAGTLTDELNQGSFAREVFTEAARATVCARGGELWPFAWPMVNIARWGRVHWG